jgi:hypothetical protein
MEEAAGEDKNTPENDVDRALADAAREADPVPAAVVDAAKQAYAQRPSVTGATQASAADETADSTFPGISAETSVAN